MNKKYYASIMFFQSNDAEEIDNFRNEIDDDDNKILDYVSMWDNGDNEYQSVFTHEINYSGDFVVAENEHYILIGNNENGGTYDLCVKLSEEEFNAENARLDGKLSDLIEK